MTFPSADTTPKVIQETAKFTIENLQVEVLSYLDQRTDGVYSFKVKILAPDASTNSGKLGLLRVGSVEGGLSRELKLREALRDYKMIAELLAQTREESVIINTRSPVLNEEREEKEENETQAVQENVVTTVDSPVAPLGEDAVPATDLTSTVSAEDDSNLKSPEEGSNASSEVKEDSDYLEEEFYPEKEIGSDSSTPKLILLSYFPDEAETLETWLKKEHSLEESLSLASQVCQFFRYVYQREWCFVDILPQLIQMGTPIQFYDLTSAYPVGETLSSGLLEHYCASELAYGKNPIHESMSSYTVGALLYQSVHKQPLPQDQENEFKIEPIPRIYQLLKICLSPLPEERFPLSQLLSLLVETRQSLRTSQVQWVVASRSTVGLSTSRLQNEDNYGVRQQQISNSETMILGVVADGMGGMAQGEVASQLAVKTALEEPIPPEFNTEEQRTDWLVSLFHKANESISNAVRDGGTTLSAVLAIAHELMIAHVGDSRIYLLRKGEKIRQLSEDHSLVGTLVASGQITDEESLDHPDRNILTKSLGSKRRLSDGYVQDLRRTTPGLSMNLKDGDILLLCSDGVWDLVSTDELADIFAHDEDLQSAVDKTIQKVLNRGAFDNATLLVLKCRIEKVY
jgi:protein phosphatase